MSLQLIDFNDEIEYIDIDASLVPYSFSIKLEDRTYEMTVKYNEIGGFYTIDLFDLNGEVLAFGDIVRYGRPLFNVIENENFPIPVIVPYCITEDGISEVTEDNFGKEVKLYLYERLVD